MDDTRHIKIDSELHDELCEYCDREGLRLSDFIEDSLENAIYRHEQYKTVNEAKKLMKEIEGERARSYRRGFLQGFYAAFCAANGNLNILENAGEKMLEESPFRLITGRQLNLFE